MRIRSFLAAAVFANVLALPVMAGSGYQYGSKDIVETAMGSADHETLVTAVKAAGLVETLQGDGPFTVFAPTDAAFAQLPDGTVAGLLEPDNRQQLSAILTYHVVPGRIDAKTIVGAIESNGGSASYETVNGDSLTFRLDDGGVVVEDAKGAVARVAAADLESSNGVIHVIDGVLLPS